MLVENYDQFRDALREMGFLLFGGGKGEMIELDDIVRPESWHVGDEYTDPWHWKDRLAASRQGAYVRALDGRATLVDETWIPTFIAAFQEELSIEERYEDGRIDQTTLRMARLFNERPEWPRHELTRALDVDPKHKGAFVSALTKLQAEMAIVASGQAQRFSKQGLPYGWASMQYTRLDAWAAPAWLEAAQEWTQTQARTAVREQILRLSPQCPPKALARLSRIGAREQ